MLSYVLGFISIIFIFTSDCFINVTRCTEPNVINRFKKKKKKENHRHQSDLLAILTMNEIQLQIHPMRTYTQKS